MQHEYTAKEINGQHISLNIQRLFWSKVMIGNGCWIWTGYRDKKGYGQLTTERRNGHKQWKAHRLAWGLTFGHIPNGKLVCHHCDNPPCVNPEHLFLGTHNDNAQDCLSKHRTATGTKHKSQTKPESVARGERVSSAILCAKDVEAIRKLHSCGDIQRRLAARFRVHPNTINKIVLRETWKHIA